MTNYEKFKKMSIEELADELNHIGNVPCACCDDASCTGDSTVVTRCVKGIIKYLERDATEDCDNE